MKRAHLLQFLLATIVFGADAGAGLFCCKNHSPRHSASNHEMMKKLSAENGCEGWRPSGIAALPEDLQVAVELAVGRAASSEPILSTVIGEDGEIENKSIVREVRGAGGELSGFTWLDLGDAGEDIAWKIETEGRRASVQKMNQDGGELVRFTIIKDKKGMPVLIKQTDLQRGAVSTYRVESATGEDGSTEQVVAEDGGQPLRSFKFSKDGRIEEVKFFALGEPVGSAKLRYDDSGKLLGEKLFAGEELMSELDYKYSDLEGALKREGKIAAPER